MQTWTSYDTISTIKFKADINEVKSSIQKLENSIEFTQGEVDSLKEQVKQESKKHATDVESLHKLVTE